MRGTVLIFARLLALLNNIIPLNKGLLLIIIRYFFSMTSSDVARMTVNLGDHNIRSSFETQHVVKKVKRVVRHRSFDLRTLYNDIALLTLDSPVQYSRSVKPICLPTGTKNYGGTYGIVAGWGSLRESKLKFDLQNPS